MTPYGLDALEALRVEKGYIGVGAEADGRTTPHDVGLGRLLSSRKPCIGAAMLDRPALRSDERLQLVGLVPLDGVSVLHEGAQLLADPDVSAAPAPIGHVSSAAWSVTRDGPIALAMLSGGRSRHGETVHVADPVRGRAPVAARVTEPCFYDPAGEHLRD